MKKIIIYLVGAAAIATPASVQSRAKRAPAKAITKVAPADPVFSFLGVTPENAVTSANVGDRLCSVAAAGKTECSAPYSNSFKIGNATVQYLSILFNNGKMYAVIGSVRGFAYNDLIAAFQAKYGAPSGVKSEKWQSKAGATFDNVVSIWQFKGGELEVKAMGSRRDDSDFTFFHNANAPNVDRPPVNF